MPTSTSSAPPQQIHASQRSSEKLEPSQEGGVGGLIVRPFSPPNVPENLSASAGSPTAKASVAPARYGPRSRLAAAPRGMPTSSVAITAAISAGTSAHCSLPTNSATVYAP